eukprot:CAMPEP_0119562482 /NCGR_PEP_ID=MMETSP1352-20130426/20592_1 /TAXON_ID=265584 /ORGANISM="Stauroneis constricta, Strain CCMP1120" /LENGTH=717 /DNA_ID=CAMNT_0007610897 /DNA_START=144 /DNA_END=2294 /DNA_ORIENTATION=+
MIRSRAGVPRMASSSSSSMKSQRMSCRSSVLPLPLPIMLVGVLIGFGSCQLQRVAAASATISEPQTFTASMASERQLQSLPAHRHHHQQQKRNLRNNSNQKEQRELAVRDYLTSEDDYEEIMLTTPITLEVYETSGFLSVLATNELAFGVSSYLFLTLQDQLRNDADTQNEFQLLLDAVPVLDKISSLVIENSNTIMPIPASVSTTAATEAANGGNRRLQSDGTGADADTTPQDGTNTSITGSRLQLQISVKWEALEDSDGNSDGLLDSTEGGSTRDVATQSLFYDLIDKALQGDLDQANGTSSVASRSTRIRQPSQYLLSNMTLANLDEFDKITSVLYFPPTTAPTAAPAEVDEETEVPVAAPTTVSGANRDVPALSESDGRSNRLWPALIVTAGVFILTSLWIAFRRRRGVNLDDLASLHTDDGTDDGYRGARRRRHFRKASKPHAHSGVENSYNDGNANNVNNPRQTFQDEERVHSFVLRNAITGSEPEPLPYTHAAAAAASISARKAAANNRNSSKMNSNNAILPSADDMVRMPDGTHIHHNGPSPQDRTSSSVSNNNGSSSSSRFPMPAGYRTSPMPLELASDVDSDSHQSHPEVEDHHFDRNGALQFRQMSSSSNSRSNQVSSTTARWEEEWRLMGNVPMAGTAQQAQQQRPNAATAINDSNRPQSPNTLGDDISNYSNNSDTTNSSNDALLVPSHNGTGLFCPYSTTASM